MKKTLTTFATLALFLLASAASARAQSNQRLQTADVPFEFVAGDRTFPAGVYRVERVNPQSPVSVLSIRSEDGKLSVLVTTSSVRTMSGQPAESAVLVFNRYGDHHFLSQLWQPADAEGLQIAKSRQERELRKGQRAGSPAPARETVALASARRL